MEKYRMEREIGTGGMGRVYLVKDIRVDKLWAMKVVSADKGSIQYQQLQQEAVALMQLDNAGLPTIIDAFYMEDSFAIIMEYVEGITLEEYRKQQDEISEEQVISWAVRLTEILTYLHTRNPHLVYGDMKPSNIILKSDGSLKVIDFGTITEEDNKDKKMAISMGTYGYAAPEKFGNGMDSKKAMLKGETVGAVDCRSDIYSLGATLFYLITGIDPAKPPYRLQSIRRVNSALSEGLEQILLRCTEKKPEKRYQSAEECRKDLLRYKLLEKRKRRSVWLQGMFARVLFLVAVLLSTVGVCQSSERNERWVQCCLIGSIFVAILAFGYRYYIYFKERKACFYTKQRKNILCTEKKIVGLCLMCIVLFGSPSLAKENKKFSVEVVDVQGRNILIREGSVFPYKDMLTFTWEREIRVQYQLSTDERRWRDINGTVYRFNPENLCKNDKNVTIRFRTWQNSKRRYLQKAFTIALS